MFFSPEIKTENIPISSIDFKNNSFKISKPFPDDRLKNSINTLGLLAPPLLCRERNNHIIIFGHNRLSVLRESADSVLSYVTERLDLKIYLDYVYLANFREEISPAGKIRIIRILTDIFKTDMNNILLIARNIQFPVDFLQNDLVSRFCSLPASLRDYVDLKEIGFKVIKNILTLSEEAVLLLAGWIDFSMRVNIFKGIVELAADISRRDRTVEPLRKIDLGSITDNRIREETLFREIYKIRYPEYTGIKFRADAVINNLKKKNLEIKFPEYFEKDELEVVLKINKREDLKSLKENFNRIDMNEIKKLLDLL